MYAENNGYAGAIGLWLGKKYVSYLSPFMN